MNIGDYIAVSESLTPWWSNFFGIAGFAFYLTNYTLVTFRIVSSQGIAFFLVNMLAASLVLISLTRDFNLGSALIQVFWLILGAIAVFIRLRSRWTPGKVEVVHPVVEDASTPRKPGVLPAIQRPGHMRSGVYVSSKFGPCTPVVKTPPLNGLRDQAVRERP